MRQPVPPMPLAVLVIFVGLYALATLRGVHLGVVMLPAAFVVGVGLVHLAMRDITTGFPVGIMLLLVGVTYFFGMAQANGTIDRLIASEGRELFNVWFFNRNVDALGRFRAAFQCRRHQTRPRRLARFDGARQFNLEFRVADSAASPWLALGALVWAGVDGIRRKLDLGAEGPPLPATLAEALEQGLLPDYESCVAFRRLQ